MWRRYFSIGGSSLGCLDRPDPEPTDAAPSFASVPWHCCRRACSTCIHPLVFLGGPWLSGCIPRGSRLALPPSGSQAWSRSPQQLVSKQSRVCFRIACPVELGCLWRSAGPEGSAACRVVLMTCRRYGGGDRGCRARDAVSSRPRDVSPTSPGRPRYTVGH